MTFPVDLFFSLGNFWRSFFSGEIFWNSRNRVFLKDKNGKKGLLVVNFLVPRQQLKCKHVGFQDTVE